MSYIRHGIVFWNSLFSNFIRFIQTTNDANASLTRSLNKNLKQMQREEYLIYSVVTSSDTKRARSRTHNNRTRKEIHSFTLIFCVVVVVTCVPFFFFIVYSLLFIYLPSCWSPAANRLWKIRKTRAQMNNHWSHCKMWCDHRTKTKTFIWLLTMKRDEKTIWTKLNTRAKVTTKVTPKDAK